MHEVGEEAVRPEHRAAAAKILDADGLAFSDGVQRHIAVQLANNDAKRTLSYSSRSNAVRAARTACKTIFGPVYCAFEGPDYYIYPVTLWGEINERFEFRLSPMVQEEAERLKSQ